MIDNDTILAYCTCPDNDCAQQLAERLVSERLAACVSILPGITSVYVWNNMQQSESEVLMLIKTTSQKYPALEARLNQDHPYEVPEIVATPITHGLPAYLDWIRCTVKE